MLLNSLYTIDDVREIDSESFECRVALHKEHPIFEGHFPGQPILPGVCLLEMVKDAVRIATGEELHIESASNIKFLQMVDPRVEATLVLKITMNSSDDHWNLTAISHLSTGTAHFKFKAVCR